MQKVCIYDKTGKVAADIAEMEFWKRRGDFALHIERVEEGKEIAGLSQMLTCEQPDICILVPTDLSNEWMQEIARLHGEYAGMRLIIIGGQGQYSVVRQLFLGGVFDYLLAPLVPEQLEQTLLRVYENKDYRYVVNQLSDRIDALVEHIFSGGGQELCIIQNILGKIQTDFHDPVTFQQVADKAKRHIYNIIIDRRPWLQKFLYEKDYTYKVGFSLKTREEIERQWLACFQNVSTIINKYQMIEDKLVYRIGKYVVAHVDEKLSLEKVSEGVYLNSSYISSIFKKVTGMNFTDFVAEVKVDRAKVLLRDSNVKIYDVAATVGYRNVEYFTKTFKRKTGMAPVEYQKRLQREMASR